MDLQSGYPYSLVRYGLPHDYPRLNGNIRTDVAVIGGGITFSEIAAGIVRDLILGKKSPHARIFSFERAPR